MKSKSLLYLAISIFAGLPPNVSAQPVNLGTAGNFAVLAGFEVNNTGSSVINGGHVGVSPGTAISGFPPGNVVTPYILQSATAAATQAQVDLGIAWSAAAALPVTQVLTGQNLGGLTLTPGVYFFASTAQLTGTLTLDHQNNPNAQFVFQIVSSITTASASSVVSINGGADAGCNVFWQIGASATLGTGTMFEGHLMALADITLTTGVIIDDGSALAMTGTVTLDTNQITNCIAAVAIPEPTTIALMFLGGTALGAPILWKRWRKRNTRYAVQK